MTNLERAKHAHEEAGRANDRLTAEERKAFCRWLDNRFENYPMRKRLGCAAGWLDVRTGLGGQTGDWEDLRVPDDAPDAIRGHLAAGKPFLLMTRSDGGGDWRVQVCSAGAASGEDEEGDERDTDGLYVLTSKPHRDIPFRDEESVREAMPVLLRLADPQGDRGDVAKWLGDHGHHEAELAVARLAREILAMGDREDDAEEIPF